MPSVTQGMPFLDSELIYFGWDPGSLPSVPWDSDVGLGWRFVNAFNCSTSPKPMNATPFLTPHTHSNCPLPLLASPNLSNMMQLTAASNCLTCLCQPKTINRPNTFLITCPPCYSQGPKNTCNDKGRETAYGLMTFRYRFNNHNWVP